MLITQSVGSQNAYVQKKILLKKIFSIFFFFYYTLFTDFFKINLFSKLIFLADFY